MKVCNNCGQVVLNKIEACPSCGCKEFTELLIAVYDDEETWLPPDMSHNHPQGKADDDKPPIFTG